MSQSPGGNSLGAGQPQERRFDLEDRLVAFAVSICRLVERVPRNPVGHHTGVQLIRCATSVAPHYAEARAAESRRDFIHKMSLCLKELREALAWLKLLHGLRLAANPPLAAAMRETDELIAIFVASITTAQRNPPTH